MFIFQTLYGYLLLSYIAKMTVFESQPRPRTARNGLCMNFKCLKHLDLSTVIPTTCYDEQHNGASHCPKLSSKGVNSRLVSFDGCPCLVRYFVIAEAGLSHEQLQPSRRVPRVIPVFLLTETIFLLEMLSSKQFYSAPRFVGIGLRSTKFEFPSDTS